MKQLMIFWNKMIQIISSAKQNNGDSIYLH